MREFPDDLHVGPDAILVWRGRRYRVALGRTGIRADKREGDGATPAGRFPLRRVWYRADRLPAPATGLETRALRPADGWCSTPGHGDYNRPVALPHDGEVDPLWLEDGRCDVVVEIGYNDDPPVAGRGSAIFLHVARDGLGPTAGCVALSLDDLLEVLGDVAAHTRLCVHAPPGPGSSGAAYSPRKGDDPSPRRAQ
jgi:L,D-peptidoglycan transpeptidase YkuD (ErfK/YbiS/YcfS/YnhG family)